MALPRNLCFGTLLAIALAAAGHPGSDAALHHYDQAIARNPHDPQAHLARATVLIGAGRHRDALASIARLEALAPDFNTGYLRGQVALESRDPDLAIAQLSRYLTAASDDFRAYRLRGRAHLLNGEGEKALQDLETAVAHQDPVDPGAVIEAAQLAAGLGHQQRALALLADAQPDAGAIPQLQLQTVDLLSGFGRHREALDVMETLERTTAADNPEWLVRKAAILARLARITEAKAVLEKARRQAQTRKVTPWQRRLLADIEQLRDDILGCEENTPCPLQSTQPRRHPTGAR